MYNEDNGLTTIEEVRSYIEKNYGSGHWLSKIKFKAWSYHSESRNNNGNLPFTFNNYIRHMDERDYLEQVNLNMLNCDDLGGKETVQKLLAKRIL
jgi:hypothetical protein